MPAASGPASPPGPPPLLWNAWAEPLGQPYSPAKQLKPDTVYRVRVHMSAMAYGDAPAGVAASKVSDTARRQFDEWLTTLSDQNEVELDALLIVDSAIFDTPAVVQKKLRVNLTRLRAADRFAVLDPQGPRPLEKLKNNPQQPFVFGETDFQLRTWKKLPTTATLAPIAISVWSSAAGVPQMPIDEVAFALCISGAKCEGAYPAQYGYGGFDALRASQAENSPEAAIHLVELPTGAVFGVFRQKAEGKYYTWPLKRRLEDLRKGIENDLHAFRDGDYRRQVAAGSGLLRRLIPESSDNEDASAAYTAFVSFVARHAKNAKPYDRDELPSIFFRIASATRQEPAVWPLAAMAVRTSPDEGWFLGRYFRIESPLTNQNYAGETGCLQDWQVVGPATTGTTALARSKLRLGLDDGFNRNRTLQIGGARVPIVDKMDLFERYLYGTSDVEPAPVSPAPVFLSVLSHHARDSVYFEQTEPPVHSSIIRRRFVAPSAVILNGCGTGLAGASGFIDALNRNGVHAAIATVADVEATMAGDFLACFVEQVRNGPDEGQPIGLLHTKTLRCMEAKNYGPKVLVYGLLGNSGLRICKPRMHSS
ncbi:MAG TPA: hypothetical protein VED01_02945 [Burkholderiales bacterium]|nr:hypothetical protein [Burkholderiales bacterium]